MSRLSGTCSHAARVGARLAAACLAVVLAGACAFCAPAWAAAGSDAGLAMQLAGESRISLERIDVKALPVEVTPSSIETGMPCGMTEMCGQDPCLCGAVDAYGACACNGRTQTKPSFSLECDQRGVVTLVGVFDRWFLVSLGAGQTTATLTASLPHYQEASMQLDVTVAAFGPADFAKALVAVFIVAAFLALMAALARTAAYGVVRAVRSARRHAARRRAAQLRGQDAAPAPDEEHEEREV